MSHSSHFVLPGSLTKVHIGHTLRPSWASTSRNVSHPRHTNTWGPFIMVHCWHSQGGASSFFGFLIPTLVLIWGWGPRFLNTFDTKRCPFGFLRHDRDTEAQAGQKTRRQYWHFWEACAPGVWQLEFEHSLLSLGVHCWLSRLSPSVDTCVCLWTGEVLLSKLSDSRGLETVRLQSWFAFGCLVLSSPASENQFSAQLKGAQSSVKATYKIASKLKKTWK